MHQKHQILCKIPYGYLTKDVQEFYIEKYEMLLREITECLNKWRDTFMDWKVH